jgi:hypothetical protein
MPDSRPRVESGAGLDAWSGSLGTRKSVRVSLLAVKLIVTPLMILAASLAGRRWGTAVGGWLVGLPLTSGPVAVFLAIERGADFAAEASAGSLASVVAQAGFCLGYALAAPWGWPAGLVGGAGAFAASAAVLQADGFAWATLSAPALGALVVTLRLPPLDSHGARRAIRDAEAGARRKEAPGRVNPAKWKWPGPARPFPIVRSSRGRHLPWSGPRSRQ